MNEVQVSLDDVGRVQLRRAGGDEGVYTLETTEALRAFFQAERDEQLGRWRDPQNPDMVVYPHDDVTITVLDEVDGKRFWWTRGDELDDHQERFPGFDTARAYFAAHPKPEPKPWEDAKEGDCWVLTIGGETSLWRRRESRELFWMDGEVPSGTTLKDATAGHRIWPEGEASE